MIGARSAGSIKIILALLDGLRVWDGRFQPILLSAGVLWTESPSSSGSSYPAERGGFLRERGDIVAEFRNVLTELLQTGWLTRWVWRN